MTEACIHLNDILKVKNLPNVFVYCDAGFEISHTIVQIYLKVQNLTGYLEFAN